MELKAGQTVLVRRLETLAFGKPKYCYFQAKVMCVCNGYAMLRRSGNVPFVESVKDLLSWLEANAT